MDSFSLDNCFVTIKDIFNTIQGEGSLAGRPSTFIRFSGCNVKDCFNGKCDTDWKDGRALSVYSVLDRIDSLKPYNHFVITGGEPLSQKYLLLLVVELFRNYRGCSVQIETSASKHLSDHYVFAGMTFLKNAKNVLYNFEENFPIFFTCSPKMHRREFENDLRNSISMLAAFGHGELKFVLDPEVTPLSDFARLIDDPQIDRLCKERNVERYIMLEEVFSQELIASGSAGSFFEALYSLYAVDKYKISSRLQNYFEIK
jgi:organic radical activating enzyme